MTRDDIILIAMALTIATTTSGPASAGGQATVPATPSSAVTLTSARSHPAPAGFPGRARLLVHTMPGNDGGSVQASALLFTPPAGSWPVVAWAHGTTTPGEKTCAPSLTHEFLDGGLTRDDFKSDYAFQIAQFLNAGYAVVAPDLEGLGPVATVPHPYFGEASFARSLIAGVQAARRAEPALSDRVATVRHSGGGHRALSVDAHIGESPELTLAGIVASAPNTSLAPVARTYRVSARTLSGKAAEEARVNEAHRVMPMKVGLSAQSPTMTRVRSSGMSRSGSCPGSGRSAPFRCSP